MTYGNKFSVLLGCQECLKIMPVDVSCRMPNQLTQDLDLRYHSFESCPLNPFSFSWEVGCHHWTLLLWHPPTEEKKNQNSFLTLHNVMFENSRAWSIPTKLLRAFWFCIGHFYDTEMNRAQIHFCLVNLNPRTHDCRIHLPLATTNFNMWFCKWGAHLTHLVPDRVSILSSLKTNLPWKTPLEAPRITWLTPC